MKRILIALFTVTAMFAWYSANAQTSSELEAARALARSYGYSESEINALMMSQTGDLKSQNSLQGTLTNDIPTRAGEDDFTVALEQAEEDTLTHKIYGHSFLSSKANGTVPSLNTPAPENYILGAGDEVQIDIWGSTNAQIHGKIGKDGCLMVNNYGPVNLGGLTIHAAETQLKSRLSRIYSGLGSGGANLKITVGRPRSLSVNVVGEVNAPGIYALPAMSSIATALFVAGGVQETASVRAIKLFREGKLVGTFDLYDFIFNGKYASNLKLQDNDVVSVPTYEAVVEVKGEVKREMFYEALPGETIRDLIAFAGGWTDEADHSIAHVDRLAGGEVSSYEIPAAQFDSYPVCSSDIISLRGTTTKILNRVNIDGAVNHPGDYSISEGMNGVKELIEKAGGLAEGAYKATAVIHRLNEDRLPSSVGFNVDDVMNGNISVRLLREDSLYVYFTKDVQDELYVTTFGAVNEEKKMPYRHGMTLNEAVLESGGFSNGADISNIEVATKGSHEKHYITRYDLKAHPEDANIELKAFDQIFVRKLENYRKFQTIEIDGEVQFPGTYVIDKTVVRLSDIIERSGGFTENAYAKGVRLDRSLTIEEEARLKVAMDIAEQLAENSTVKRKRNDGTLENVKDTLVTFNPEETYTIGIDIEKAIANPGSEADVILRTGDKITVPQMNNTVKISGAVFYPNVVVFNSKYVLRDYLNQAGGVLKAGKRRQIYAVYMNGMVSKKGASTFKMEPGMEIVVPKEIKQERALTSAEIAAIASSSTSIAYMATALVRMFL